MDPASRVEIDLARRPDCSLIAFVDDVAELVLVIPMTAAPPAIGQRRSLRLVLQTGTITGMAEVRYHRAGGGCGAAFVALEPPDRAILEAFVRASTTTSRVLLPPATRRADEPRRSHERIPAQIDVQVERPRSLPPKPAETPELVADVTFESEHNFYAGFSENIGDGGLFVQSWAAHAVGERLKLKVTLPDSDEPVDILGEVRWTRTYNRHDETPPGIGVAFIDLPASIKQRVDTFILQRRPLFYDD